MRTSLRLAGAAFALHSSAVLAAPTSQPVRVAEIITMAALPEPEHVPVPDGERAADAIEEADRPSLDRAFRLHDLSRRWVEYQMADAYGGGSATPIVGDEAQRATVAGIALSAPAIDVPGWMQGGSAGPGSPSLASGCGATGYRPAGFLSADTEARRRAYYEMMSRIACEHGIPVGLFDAMIISESRYKASAVSPKNAFGLTQLLPGTAAGLGVNPYDVVDNLRGGARYMRQQLDRFGQADLALAAYNAGPGRVRDGRVPAIAETQAYVHDVLRDWPRLETAAGYPLSTPVTAEARFVPAERRATVLLF